MVPIRQYSQYWENNIKPYIIGLSSVIRVTTDAQLTKKINQVNHGDIFLVVVVPSATDNMTDIDNRGDENMGLLYVLKKTAGDDRTASDELADLEQTQNAALAIRELVYAHHNDCTKPYFVRHIQFQAIDPEYNYLGCDGYSMSLKIAD